MNPCLIRNKTLFHIHEYLIVIYSITAKITKLFIWMMFCLCDYPLN